MKNSSLLCGLIATLLLVLCAIPSFFFWKQGGTSYEIWFIGDSIIAGNTELNSIPAYVERTTGIKTLNAGFGGQLMSDVLDNDATNVYNSYNMVNISRGIKNHDLSFSGLNSQKDNQINIWYWEKHAKNLSEADIRKCRYLFIEFGTNDYFSETPVDDEKDKYNTGTFAGAMRTVIENVRAGMPDATVVLITPPYNSIDTSGPELDAYVTKEVEIASEYGIRLVNNYELSMINANNYTEYLIDGIHPNEKGVEKLSEGICRLINEMKEN